MDEDDAQARSGVLKGMDAGGTGAGDPDDKGVLGGMRGWRSGMMCDSVHM